MAPAPAPPGPPSREGKRPRCPPAAQQGRGSAGALPWWGILGTEVLSAHHGPAARPGVGHSTGLRFGQGGLWGVTAAGQKTTPVLLLERALPPESGDVRGWAPLASKYKQLLK